MGTHGAARMGSDIDAVKRLVDVFESNPPTRSRGCVVTVSSISSRASLSRHCWFLANPASVKVLYLPHLSGIKTCKVCAILLLQQILHCCMHYN